MIELRRRWSRSSGYEPLSTEDDLDKLPKLNATIAKAVPIRSPSICKIILFNPYFSMGGLISLNIGPKILSFFSISGVFFLSILYRLVEKKSPYIGINLKEEKLRENIATGILEAISIYAIVAVISLVIWYRMVKNVGHVNEWELQRLND